MVFIFRVVLPELVVFFLRLFLVVIAPDEGINPKLAGEKNILGLC